jgi:hypothetical protein
MVMAILSCTVQREREKKAIAQVLGCLTRHLTFPFTVSTTGYEANVWGPLQIRFGCVLYDTENTNHSSGYFVHTYYVFQ